VALTASGQFIIGEDETPGSAATVPLAGAISIGGFAVFANLVAAFEADFAPRLAQQS
jgi:hypothetical protein